MFQIGIRMEAGEEGFVEVLFCQTKYGIWNNLSFCFFQIVGKEKEEKGDFESPILLLLRRSLEDSEKPWQRHLLVGLVPAWLAIVTFAIWVLATI